MKNMRTRLFSKFGSLRPLGVISLEASRGHLGRDKFYDLSPEQCETSSATVKCSARKAQLRNGDRCFFSILPDSSFDVAGQAEVAICRGKDNTTLGDHEGFDRYSHTCD